MIRDYNYKFGTNFTTMQQVQDDMKVRQYNAMQNTRFTTLTQVREDYNRRYHTNFRTNQEFRDWINKSN